MCGIAGFIDSTLTNGTTVLENMLQNIAHRGPDARHCYNHQSAFLGHNRLSIIDLSHEADQPMHLDNISIVFNGEIYNYLELKKELSESGIVFKTQSDTEVILHAYQKWGANCVNRFVGMWAFAIWNNKTEELFCSRDRFGIKPFYYIAQGLKFYFGSEYKALKASPLFSNEINTQQVSRGLQMGWICYRDETYFSKIIALPAGHNMLFNGRTGELKSYAYWKLETGNYSSLSFEEKKQTFYALFADSIKLHMRSDVPVASCLRGGLDSSAIVSMIQHQNPGAVYKTFSIYYEGRNDVDERPFVKKVIEKYPSLEPHYFSPNDDLVQSHFHHALYHADVPSTGSSFISQYFLMKLIGENGIKVVLDGQGADEYLAGYMHTYYRMVADLLKKMQWLKAITLTRDLAKNQGLSGSKTLSHFGKSILSTFNNEHHLYSLEYKNYYPFLSADTSSAPFELEDQQGNKTDNFLYQLLFNTSLPSLLHYEDRNSMAFSIESRVPFLDHRLVEFCFTLNNEDKADTIFTKWIMRNALNGVLPHDITHRKDKKGFVTPGENKWLRGPLKHLLDVDFSRLDFLQQKKAGAILNDYKKGDNSKAVLAWRLATLAYWEKNFR